MADNQYTQHTPLYPPKCVMITGATSGFGTAFAHRFAALGCALVLHGRNEERLDALIKTLNVPTHKIIFDITNKEQTRTQIKAIPEAFQNIDLLINNAGGALGLDKFQDADLNDLENMIEMNNTSLIRITREILPQMTANKKGHVINISSMAGGQSVRQTILAGVAQ